MLGGSLWLLIWVHFLLTHGPTSIDYKETFFGLSYYDSTKLVVFALALCMVGLVSLRDRAKRGVPTRAGTLGHYLALSGLVGMIVGVVIAFWAVPWGDTTIVATTLMKYGFIGMGMASLVAFLGLTVLGIGLVRPKVLPAWAVAPLIIAGLAAIPWLHHTLHGVLIGLGWLTLGWALWRSETRLTVDERVGLRILASQDS